MAKKFSRCDTCDLDFTYLDNPICPRCKANILGLDKLTGLQRAALEIDKLREGLPKKLGLFTGIDIGLGQALGVLKSEIKREEDKCG